MEPGSGNLPGAACIVREDRRAARGIVHRTTARRLRAACVSAGRSIHLRRRAQPCRKDRTGRAAGESTGVRERRVRGVVELRNRCGAASDARSRAGRECVARRRGRVLRRVGRIRQTGSDGDIARAVRTAGRTDEHPRRPFCRNERRCACVFGQRRTDDRVELSFGSRVGARSPGTGHGITLRGRDRREVPPRRGLADRR